MFSIRLFFILLINKYIRRALLIINDWRINRNFKIPEKKFFLKCKGREEEEEEKMLWCEER